MAVQTMSLRDLLEYRLANETRSYFDLDDVPLRGDDRTLYSRTFGSTMWGWHSGPFIFDAEYKASNTWADA